MVVNSYFIHALNKPNKEKDIKMRITSIIKKGNWHLLYYLLAFLDLVTIFLSLYYNHLLMESYSKSVDTNAKWAYRLVTYSKLGQFATAVNSPSLDLLESRNLTHNENEYTAAKNQFDLQYRLAVYDLKRDSLPETLRVLELLSRVEHALEKVNKETELIFRFFAQGQRQKVIQRIAANDRKFAAVNTALFQLRMTVSGIQQDNLLRQQAEAEYLKKYHFQITMFILVMILITTLHGHSLSRRTQATIVAKEVALKQLELAKNQAVEATKIKGEFLANMSHEIRTPMNGILGMTELLIESNPSNEQRDLLETVQSSAKSLLSIINDILDFSKIEAGKVELSPVNFELFKIANDVKTMFSPRCKEKGISLRLDIDKNIPKYLFADSLRLNQILLNLMSNAIKFTNRPGWVALEAKLIDQNNENVQIHFSVADSGIGIPRDKQDRIFEAFAQADASTTRKHGGTGLGLSISSSIVELMGGKLQVESEPGVGSCFSFSITLERCRGVIPQENNALPEINSSSKPLTILVAEDNLTNQKLAMRILEKLGHKVLIAVNGEEAVKMYSLNPVDIILMDVQMPVMDGSAATKSIREREKLEGKHTPIIALTAHAMFGDREKYLALGMDEYVTKPINRIDLIEKIGRLTQSVHRIEDEPDADASRHFS